MVVADGTVELTLSGPYKGRLRQGLATKGDYFGDADLLDAGAPVPAVKALSAVTLLTLDSSALVDDESIRSRIGQYGEERDRLKGHTNSYGEQGIELLAVHTGEPRLPTTFVDYEIDPREYHLSTIQTILNTHTASPISTRTRSTSSRADPPHRRRGEGARGVGTPEQLGLRLLNEVTGRQRIPTPRRPAHPGRPRRTADARVEEASLLRGPPRAIAAFGREATRRGVPPVVVHLFGAPFITWRGVPLVPSDKLPIDIDPVTGAQTTSILLLRVGEGEQGVVGLQKSGVTGEIEPGLSVRYMGTNDHSIASHLVTRYFSAAVLVEDAIARLDNVLLGNYHDYA